MSYTLLANGLLRLPHDDFKFIDASGGSPGYFSEQMLSGYIQKQAQTALRNLMHQGASFYSIASSSLLNEDELRMQGFSDEMIKTKNDNLRHEINEIVGVNLAMALSIPADDYLDLHDYAYDVTDEPGSGNSDQILNEVKIINIEYNLLNFYKILRSLKDENWRVLEKSPSYHRRSLTQIAVLCDDALMIRRLESIYYESEDLDVKVAALLADMPYDAMSQVRFETSQPKGILMSEIRARIDNQMEALEHVHPRVALTQLDSSKTGDEPDIGHFDLSEIGVRSIDRAIDRLPRYHEYLECNAHEVMKDIWLTLNRSEAPACAERTSVLSRLLKDLEAHGITMKELVLRGIKGMSNPEFMDNLDRPGGGYIASIRVLLEDLKRTSERPLKRFMIAETLKKVPAEDVLMAARNDSELSSAFEHTGNKTFLEHMSHQGVEDRLSHDLGL